QITAPASPPCTRCVHDAAPPRKSWCVQSYDTAFESTPALTGSADEVVDPACYVRSSDPAGSARTPCSLLALRASYRASPVHGPLREPYPLRERPDPATRDRSAA